MKYLYMVMALIVIVVVGFVVVFKSSQEKEVVNMIPTQNVQVSMETSSPTQSPIAENNSPDTTDKTKFNEKEVTVGTGEWKLPGTLTMPDGAGPFPVVILVHGSGPQDRDETIGANKPFRDLAWGLASQGIAVLRYEKRTKEYQTKMAAMQNSITVKEETLDDVNAAVNYVKSAEKINPGKIFILGHSLGGMLMPRIAKANPDAAGYIIMAGLTRPMEDTMLDQLTYIASLPGESGKKAATMLAQVKEQVQNVKSKDLSLNTPSSTLPFGSPASYWLDLRGYNPAEMAKSIEKPMLILQGQRDYQVTVEDFDNWKTALSAKSNIEYKLYPKLYHLFIEAEGKGEGKSTPEEYTHPGHVAEYVITDIATWVKGK